jgi:hypothetical protein
MPVPKSFLIVAQPALNVTLIQALTQDELDVDAVRRIVEHMRNWKVDLELPDTEFFMRHHAEVRMRAFAGNPGDLGQMNKMQKLLGLLSEIPLEIVLWQIQNDYYELAKKVYPEYAAKAGGGDEDAKAWVEGFKSLGEMLRFNLGTVLPQV